MQKTASEVGISGWSSDVCSSDLGDRDTRSGPLHDWEPSRADDGGYAYGGYPEAGFGPRETRRYGDYGRSGRERTERGHYSADHPRDYAGNDWNRSYGARRYWDDDQRYGARDRDRHDREDRQSAWKIGRAHV